MANVINATSTGNGGLVSTGDDSGILNIQTNETTAITVDASQNVGIGGTGYTEKLTVNGAIVSKGTATANQTSAIALDATYSSSVSAIRAWGASGTTASIAFLTGSGGSNDAERMRIDSSGNLLLGGTGTGGNLTISGKGSEGWAVKMLTPINSGTYNFINFCLSNTSQVGSIQSNGSTTSYNTSSDYRLKENIAPMTGALGVVQQLKPVTYKWKSTGEESQGFIAHELQAVVPDCVTGEKDAVDENGKIVPQGIDTSFLVATLTAALQETKALIDTQAATINALTARIVALEGQ